jgi:hypothetical protein
VFRNLGRARRKSRMAKGTLKPETLKVWGAAPLALVHLISLVILALMLFLGSLAIHEAIHIHQAVLIS